MLAHQTLVVFRLFCKNMGNLLEFLGFCQMVHSTFGKSHTELSFEGQEARRSSLNPRDQT